MPRRNRVRIQYCASKELLSDPVTYAGLICFSRVFGTSTEIEPHPQSSQNICRCRAVNTCRMKYKIIDVTIISHCGRQLHAFTVLLHIIMTIHLQQHAQYFGLH